MERYLYNAVAAMERHSNSAIKTKSWYGTVVLRNNYVKKQMINDINNDVKSMSYFLNFYMLTYESNVDIVFFASYKGLSPRQLLALCKYLYDTHGYLAFSSRTRLDRFLRKTNQATVKTYEKKLYSLVCYYTNALLVSLVVTLIQYLMTLYLL